MSIFKSGSPFHCLQRWKPAFTLWTPVRLKVVTFKGEIRKSKRKWKVAIKVVRPESELNLPQKKKDFSLPRGPWGEAEQREHQCAWKSSQHEVKISMSYNDIYYNLLYYLLKHFIKSAVSPLRPNMPYWQNLCFHILVLDQTCPLPEISSQEWETTTFIIVIFKIPFHWLLTFICPEGAQAPWTCLRPLKIRAFFFFLKARLRYGGWVMTAWKRTAYWPLDTIDPNKTPPHLSPEGNKNPSHFSLLV